MHDYVIEIHAGQRIEMDTHPAGRNSSPQPGNPSGGRANSIPGLCMVSRDTFTAEV